MVAWSDYRKAVEDCRTLQAGEEILKLEVRQQYEYNWLDARRAFGTAVANRIFPKAPHRAAGAGDLIDEQQLDSGE